MNAIQLSNSYFHHNIQYFTKYFYAFSCGVRLRLRRSLNHASLTNTQQTNPEIRQRIETILAKNTSNFIRKCTGHYQNRSQKRYQNEPKLHPWGCPGGSKIGSVLFVIFLPPFGSENDSILTPFWHHVPHFWGTIF